MLAGETITALLYRYVRVSKKTPREQQGASAALLHEAIVEVVERFGRAERLTIRKALYDRGTAAELIDSVSERLPDGVAFLTVESVWDYLAGMSSGTGQ
jgi:hypothetical protein